MVYFVLILNALNIVSGSCLSYTELQCYYSYFRKVLESKKLKRDGVFHKTRFRVNLVTIVMDL